MIEAAFYAVALTTAAWAVWVRRRSWGIPWERPTTSAILQLMLALILLAPAAEPYTGRLGFELTGHWHLDDLLGFMFCIGAGVASNIAAMMRMPTMRRHINAMLWTPLVIGTAVQMQVFLHSVATHDPSSDIFQVHQHLWLTIFFGLQSTLVGYFCGVNAWCAQVHLREGHPDSRPVCVSWLICVGVAVGAILGFALPAILGAPHYLGYSRLAMCVCVVIFSVASARSWQRKLVPWRNLILATGARL